MGYTQASGFVYYVIKDGIITERLADPETFQPIERRKKKSWAMRPTTGQKEN